MLRQAVLTTLTCGALADEGQDYSLDLSDPWTIASIAILSLLALLCLIRVVMTFFTVSVETEEVGVEMTRSQRRK